MDNTKHKLIIITAPSGAGKTSIVHYLLQQIPKLAFSISAATRAPRAGEVNGKDYYFISTAEFEKKIQENEFIEWEMVYEGKYYGTLKAELERLWHLDKIPILDIDVKGALHVQKQFAQKSLSIFIEPPSIKELQDRLQARGTETPETLATRVSKASYEISFKQNFDKIITNVHLQTACEQTQEVIKQYINN
jgi:guanylate kinase